MNKIITTALALSLSLIIPAWGSDTLPELDSLRHFDDAKVIRVKYADGDAFVEREHEKGWEDLIENLPIFEGDFLSTEDGRIELYLGRLNYLRIDQNSHLEIVRAPALRSTIWTLELISGSIILDLHQLDVDTQTSVRTPDCEVFFVTPGVFRIDSFEAGDTRVLAIEGTVQVYGDHGHTRLNRGQELLMGNGSVLQQNRSVLEIDADDFMAFHQERTRGETLSRTIGSSRLKEGLNEYEPELARHGRWEYSPIYGSQIWYPYGMSHEWQPYLNGRWNWHPVYGYVWTSYDPCGWITHHYGRWHWHPGHGWYWIPGYQWSPAWVHWGWQNEYYGWVPLGYNNRPVIVINKRWLRDYNYSQGLPTRASSVVIVHRDRFRSSRMSDFITRRIGSDLIEDRLQFRGREPLVLINDPLLQGRTRSGKTVLIKQSSVRRTQVDSTIPVVVPKRGDDRPPMDDSLRSVRKVIREKTPPRVQTETSGSSSGSSRSPVTIKKSGSDRSSAPPPKGSSGSKTVIKKKKEGG